MSSDDGTQLAPRRPLEAWEKPWWGLLLQFVDVVDELRTLVRTGPASPAGGTTQYFGQIRAAYNMTAYSLDDSHDPHKILLMSGMDDFVHCTQEFWEGTVRGTLDLDSTDVAWDWLRDNGAPDRWKSNTPTEKSAVFQLLRQKCQGIQALITTLLDKFKKSRPLQYFVSYVFIRGTDAQTKRYFAVQEVVKQHISLLQDLQTGRLDPMLIGTFEDRDVSTFNWTSSTAPRDPPQPDMFAMRACLQRIE
jgi:hypothetical protein